MIHFRCWYCNRRYKMADSRMGERFTCNCKYLLRVPKRDGGNCRLKSPLDWFLEITLYGGGGALLGLGLGLLILSRAHAYFPYRGGLMLVGGLTLGGLLAGALGGERGVEWLGRLIRDRETS